MLNPYFKLNLQDPLVRMEPSRMPALGQCFFEGGVAPPHLRQTETGRIRAEGKVA